MVSIRFQVIAICLFVSICNIVVNANEQPSLISTIKKNLIKGISLNPLQLSSQKEGVENNLSVESDDTFIPFVARRVEPSPNPGNGFCAFPFVSNNVYFTPRLQTVRKTFSVRRITKVRVISKIESQGVRINLRLTQQRRFYMSRVGTNVFLDSKFVSVNRRSLRPFTRYNRRRNVSRFKKLFRINNFSIPKGKVSCCDSSATIGFFVRVCDKRSSNCSTVLGTVKLRLECNGSRNRSKW